MYLKINARSFYGTKDIGIACKACKDVVIVVLQKGRQTTSPMPGCGMRRGPKLAL